MLYDKDIREGLFEFLDENFGKNRIIEEKQIGKSRADAMMVTKDKIWGIEIKSDADTFARLERQVKDYNRFFDYNIVAVGASHASHIEEHVPDYWGIITIEDNGGIPDFYFLRQPKPNPKKEKAVMFRNQVSFLWRPELAHVQEINDMPKYKTLSKANVIKKIIEKVPADILKEQVCQELFDRDYTTIADVLKEYRESSTKKSETKSVKTKAKSSASKAGSKRRSKTSQE